MSYMSKNISISCLVVNNFSLIAHLDSKRLSTALLPETQTMIIIYIATDTSFNNANL